VVARFNGHGTVAPCDVSYHLRCFKWDMPAAKHEGQQNYLEPHRGIMGYIRSAFYKYGFADFTMMGGFRLTPWPFGQTTWKLVPGEDIFRRRVHVVYLELGPLRMWCRIEEMFGGTNWIPAGEGTDVRDAQRR
jgi:hypothetical protein